MGNIVYETLKSMEWLLEILIMIRFVISWIPFLGRSHPIVNFVFSLTEPILSPIRDVIRKSPIGGIGMTLDFSPVIALLIMRAAINVIGSILGAL